MAGIMEKMYGNQGGGSGGDPHNKGSFLTPAALREAYPTAEPGDFAIVESTDTIWVWDADTSDWKDGDQKGQVTSVNGQTGDVVIPNELPDQTGQSGKFLTTDGTNASWSDKPLANTATGAGALTLLGTPTNQRYSINIGQQTTTRAENSVTLGAVAESTGINSVAVGYSSKSNNSYAISIGSNAQATGRVAISIGAFAQATAEKAIQLGEGTNSAANTFKVANANGNFELMSADGTIPKERLTNVVTTPSTAPVLAVADWSSNTQTITVAGVTATNTVFVAPAPASAADYAAAGILCTAQSANSLTFTCTTVPSNAITLSVVILG